MKDVYQCVAWTVAAPSISKSAGSSMQATWVHGRSTVVCAKTGMVFTAFQRRRWCFILSRLPRPLVVFCWANTRLIKVIGNAGGRIALWGERNWRRLLAVQALGLFFSVMHVTATLNWLEIGVLYVCFFRYTLFVSNTLEYSCKRLIAGICCYNL